MSKDIIKDVAAYSVPEEYDADAVILKSLSQQHTDALEIAYLAFKYGVMKRDGKKF